MEHFIEEKYFQKKFAFIYLTFFVLIWGVVLLLIKFSPGLSTNLRISEHNLILPSIMLVLTVIALFLKKINLKISLILITLLVIFDLFYFFNKITPFAPSVLVYPKTPVISYIQQNAGINRYWGYGSAYIQPNYQEFDQTFSPEGNDALHISRYGELLNSSLDGKIQLPLPRMEANVAPGYGTSDLSTNNNRKKVLDLLGVKYVLNYQDLKDAWQNADLSTFPPQDYTLVYKVYPWQVYENKNALPRFFLADNYVLAKDKSQVLADIYNSNLNLKQTLIVESAPDLAIDKKATGTVQLVSYKPNSIVFKVKTNGNSLLFLSDNYYPEWKVSIDGKPATLLITDYTFRSVAVPKGEHVVRFYYDPKTFELGLGTTAVGLLGLFLITIYVKKSK